MVPGSPGPERANTPRVCSLEAEFSAEMLAGAPPWDVLQPHHQPSASYQPCGHRKGPSHLRISSSAKKIETRRLILKFLPACDCDSGHPCCHLSCTLSGRDLENGHISSHPVIGPASEGVSLPSRPMCLLHFTESCPGSKPVLCPSHFRPCHSGLWGKESLPLSVSVCSYTHRNSVYNILLYPLSHVVTHRQTNTSS